MSLTSTLIKGVKPLGKLGAWLGVYALTKHLTGSEEMLALAAQAGINISAICDVVCGIAPNKITDYYKEVRESSKFDVNDDLAGAFESAIDNTVTALADQFRPNETLNGYQKQQASFYFPSLGHQLKKATFSTELVRLYAETPTDFFAYLWGTHAKDAAEPDIPESVQEQMCAFAVQEFEKQFKYNLNKELKHNDKAKTAYFIDLLECVAQINRGNADMLQQISLSLDGIAQQQTEQAGLLRHIAHAQQLLHDHLRKLTVDFRQFARQSEAFQQRIDEQLEPSLTLPNITSVLAGHEYNYKTQYTTFISREAELTALWKFVSGQPQRQFTWWMITGPGGMGKSRLALELCREARYLKKHVGFLEKLDIKEFKWSKWRPRHATLVVVDYVAADAEAVSAMLSQLSRSDQEGNLSVPIRFLLLERGVREGDWWKSWLNTPELTSCSYHIDEPERLLALTAFSPDDHWQIINNVHKRQAKPLVANKEETLAKLAELDTQGRPLFALFVGMALAEGKDIHHWNVSKLLDNLLQREEDKVWKHHPRYPELGEGHKNLLLIATLTRGLLGSDIRDLYSQHINWLPAEINNDLYERLASISLAETTNGSTERLFEGLQPDLVGEYFVIKRIHYLLTQLPNGRNTIQELLQAAWTIDAQQTWWMIYQTQRDNPDDFLVEARNALLLSEPSLNSPTSDWVQWANLTVNLILYYGTVDQMEQAKLCFTSLVRMVERFPDNAQIALLEAKGAVNIMTGYVTSDQVEQSQTYFDIIVHVTERFPEDAQIANQRAMGAVNLINHYDKVGQMEQAQACFDDIKRVAVQFPNDAQIAFSQAAGANNMMIAHGKASQMEQAWACFDTISQVVKLFPNDTQIAFRQAVGAYILVNKYCIAGQMEQANACFDDIKRVAERFPNNAQIALQVALGAFNLIFAYNEAGQIQQAQAQFDTLVEVSEQFPNDAQIAFHEVIGAVNLTDAYGKAGQMEQAQACFAVVMRVADRLPDDVQIAVQQAIGAYTLTKRFCLKGQMKQAQIYFDSIIGVTERFPNDAQIALQLAMGAANLTHIYVGAGQLNQVRARFDDIARVAKRFPNDAQIALQLAMGNVNLTNIYSKVGYIEKAQASFDDIQRIAMLFPGNEQIALRQAMGGVNLTDAYGKAGQMNQAQAYYNGIVRVAERFPNDAQIALRQATGCLNLTHHYRKAGQMQQAQACYDDIVQVAKRFPNDAQVALRQAMGVGALLDSRQVTLATMSRPQLVEVLQNLLTQWRRHPDWQEKLSLLEQTLQAETGNEV